MKFKKTVSILSLLLLLLLSLCSCVDVTVETELNTDGGGTVYLSAVMTEETYNFAMNQAEDGIDPFEGFSRDTYTEEGVRYVRLRDEPIACETAEDLETTLNSLDQSALGENIFKNILLLLDEDADKLMLRGTMKSLSKTEFSSVTFVLHSPSGFELYEGRGAVLSEDGKTLTLSMAEEEISFNLNTGSLKKAQTQRTVKIVIIVVISVIAAAVIAVVSIKLFRRFRFIRGI